MPIRITCPACSATLNLKDELAGRAVKCPRCGDTIPAAAPSFEVVEDEDEPAPSKPATPKAARPKPARPKPARRRDDEDDDRPAKRTRNPAVVVGAAVCAVVALGAIGWLAFKGKKEVADVATGTPAQPAAAGQAGAATEANYQKIKLHMTRTEVEALIGPGEPATDNDALQHGFGGHTGEWRAKIKEGKVVKWGNGPSQVMVALWPDTKPTARVMARSFGPGRDKAVMDEGMYDDEDYARANLLPLADRPRKDPVFAKLQQYTAGKLAQEYANDPKTAALRYDALWVELIGDFRDVKPDGPAGVVAVLDGVTGAKPLPVRVRVSEASQVRSAKQALVGRSVRLTGRCVGLRDGALLFEEVRMMSVTEPLDYNHTIGYILLEGQFRSDFAAAQKRHKGKRHHLNSLTFVRHEADGAVVSVEGSAKPYTIKVRYEPDWKEHFAALKPQDKMPVSAVCQGVTGETMEFTNAWPLR